MTNHDYHCAECDQPIEGDDIDARHSTPDGEDCHAGCCPTCEKYLSEPDICPVCCSDSGIRAVLNEQYEDGVYNIDIACVDCDATWTEHYSLTSITIHKGGHT